jgi:prepilin-type N-terminal cleavage/methylation domain-containing protein
MNPISTRNASRGFSLVELMVAITFFGVLMLGFLTVFPLGFRTVQKGEKLTIATSLAQDEIERLKTLPVNDPDLVAGTHVDSTNPINGVYTRTWTVTDDAPIAGMTTISMAIAYSDNGIPRTIQIATYLTR